MLTQSLPIIEHPKGKAWHNQTAEDVLLQLGSSATGLSAQEAAKRLADNGPNELKEGNRVSTLRIFLGQFKSVIMRILIAAGVLSGLSGQAVDAILVIVVIDADALAGDTHSLKLRVIERWESEGGEILDRKERA